MFVELVNKQVNNDYVSKNMLAAKKSWRRQRRVQKLLARTVI